MRLIKHPQLHKNHYFLIKEKQLSHIMPYNVRLDKAFLYFEINVMEKLRN